MTARGYELDEAVRQLAETVRRLDLKQARVRLVDSGNVTVTPTAPATSTNLADLLVEIMALIAAADIAALDEGVSLTTALASLNFAGAGVTATVVRNAVTVTIPAPEGMVPYYIAAAETFTVPLYKQALFNMTIVNDGTLVVDGYLILVP